MNKSYDIDSAENQNVSEEDLVLINKYTRKPLKADEVYCFSVILCDNEVDRDFERFTVDSLNDLARLFVGKTAIKDHSMRSEDQSARTYKTEVVCDKEKKNSLGENYCYLKAYCYMPVIEKNKGLIEEIEAGIKKEVSIGCSVESVICSVCGKDKRTGACTHKKGQKYNGKICFNELVNPTDAYEWSFVAVPAQKNAGITKDFKIKEVKTLENIIKSLQNSEGEMHLNGEETEKLKNYISSLEKEAEDGKKYREELVNSTVKLFALTMPELSNNNTENICKTLSTKDLKELNKALKEKRHYVTAPQLASKQKTDEKTANSQFKF